MVWKLISKTLVLVRKLISTKQKCYVSGNRSSPGLLLGMLHCLFLDARGAFCRNDSISSPNKSFSFVFDLIIIYFDCYCLMLIVCCLTSKEATCPGPGIYVQPLCLVSFSYSESLRNQVSFISHIIQFVHTTALSLLSTLYNCHGYTNIRLIYLVLTLSL